ncbi:hypothetical protein ACFLT2_10450 [Acidobacteriota bacterium]
MSSSSSKYRGKKEYYLVFNELVSAARYRGTVTYQEIAQLIGLPLKGSYMGSEIGHLLGEISEDEVSNGRPMLSAVAVNVQGEPGPGFFVLARELGKEFDDSREGRRKFWESELHKNYEVWKKTLVNE